MSSFSGESEEGSFSSGESEEGEESDDDWNILKGDDDVPKSTPSWRLSPAESHSDFVIAVSLEPDEDGGGGADNDDDNITEYHVHKERICVGPRKSSVIAAAVHGPMKEAKQNRYAITLKKSAVQAFPVLLDCVYTGKFQFLGQREEEDRLYSRRRNDDDSTIAIDYRHIVALRFLTSYLGMQALHIQINDTIRERDFLPRHTLKGTIQALVYLCKESHLYCDEKMLLQVKKQTLQWVKESSSYNGGFNDPMWMGDVLSLAPYELMEYVWKSSWLTAFFVENKGERVDVLADALWNYRDKIDSEVIALVTSESLLPKLTPEEDLLGRPQCRPAAMKLLELVSSQSEWSSSTGSQSFSGKMKNLEQRCIEAVAEDWERVLDVRCIQDDDDGRKKKRQKIETSCQRLSSEVERKLLRSAVAKASEDLSFERARSSMWSSEYLSLTQPMHVYEGIMHWPKHSLFVFGNSGASGCYREYSHRTEGNLGIQRKYRQQCQYQYHEDGYSDDRGHCTLEYNQAKSCWQITVEYRERVDEASEGCLKRTYSRSYKDGSIEKVLLEAPRTNGSTDIPKLGWKDAITDEDRPDILALEFEAMRQIFNPNYTYDRKSAPYEPFFRP